MKTPIIPSQDYWKREDFLHARHLQMQAQKESDVAAGIADKVHYIETGDRIVCDACNAEIKDPMIHLIQFGRRVVCENCFRARYANEPLEYRMLRPDGSLGPIVKGMNHGEE